MEKYIMTFEDGEHFFSDKVTENDIDAVYDCILTIIRCSDLKQLDRDGEWVELIKWNN